MRLFFGLLLLATFPLRAAAQAPDVDCTIIVRSEPQNLIISPSKTPYDVTKIDFENGFRFAVQVLEDPHRLKTYTYFDSKDRHVLIHEGIVYLNDKSCGDSLGENTIYSPKLELELSYKCTPKCE